MKRMEMRSGERAAVRGGRTPLNARAEKNGPRERPARDLPPLPEVAIDEENARRACAPMGTLESIVVSRTARNTTRTYYVIVPDPALGKEYERLGLQLEPGCRVLVDAAALQPLAVLTVVAPGSRTPPKAPSANGFNPYFDLPGA